MEPTDWIESYRRAWEENDADLLVSLFTEDGSYRSSPFREPNLGHDGIRAYWARAVGPQRGTEVRMGEPIVEGNVVAVEWWTTTDEGEGPVTITGCLLLQFAPDGRCFDLREYWHLESGSSAPHEGWGSWPRR